jgi:hypothetical protein
MLVFLFALLILYWVLSVIGVLDSAAHLLQTSGFGSPKSGFHFNRVWIFLPAVRRGVVGCSSGPGEPVRHLLYNLVSDVVVASRSPSASAGRRPTFDRPEGGHVPLHEPAPPGVGAAGL